MANPNQKRQLAKAFHQQNGFCMYCDGATWLPSQEAKAAAAARLGIPIAQRGSTKALRACRATREHLKRRVDGGLNTITNIKMACMYCNSQRHDSEPEIHRADMQVMVAAGLHPTNRPDGVLDHQRHLSASKRAVRVLRAARAMGEAK